MVSALWKAAAEADAARLKDLLKDASQVDIEIKDHTGVTPLIQAVRSGHADNVKELLAHGADPNNASSQGRPETYTADPVILESLKAHTPPAINGYADPAAPHHAPIDGSNQEPHPPFDPAAVGYAAGPPNGFWYMPPNGGYPPYGYPMPPPPQQEGVQHPMPGYYAPPPHPQDHQQQQQQQQQPQQDGSGQQQQRGGGSPPMNIPPEVARTIPCRYFPMCRFGANCMFAHPPPGYYAGPPPPMQYPGGYDPLAHPVPYPQGYYGPPPPQQSFPPPPPTAPSPNGAVNGGPHSPVQHTTPHPPSGPFNENGVPPPPQSQIPPPVPYVIPPYPINTAPNGAPSHMVASAPPFMPAGVVIPPQPFPQQQPPSPTHHRKESTNGYPIHPQQNSGGFNGDESRTLPTFAPRNDYRRSGFRRTSFGAPKQPCLFFPAGKCKNGTECRFPHVRPEDDPAAFGPEGYPPTTFPQRSGPRPHVRSLNTQRSFGSRDDHANGADRPPMMNGNGNGFRKHFPPHDQQQQPNGRPPYAANGYKYANGNGNGAGPRTNGTPFPQKGVDKQLPSPADFPSLNGSRSITPPSTAAPVNGMTAAQVLKRAPPKDENNNGNPGLVDAMAKVSINGNGHGHASRAQSPDLPAPVFPSINDVPTSKLVAAA